MDKRNTVTNRQPQKSIQNNRKRPPTKERLEKLGFKAATKMVGKARKLAMAYEHYRYVRMEKIREFNRKLEEETRDKNGWNFQTLAFEDISVYTKIPPSHVLDSLEKAKEMNVFDSFEIAFIKTVKDPILFGCIEGCTDKFFIDQWDDDVKIQDIINDKEG